VPSPDGGMRLPALVLVHGAVHAGDCWDLTIGEIHRLAPELTVLAVDLPGRRGKPGDLSTLTIADCVDSVVSDIEDAGLGAVVIVGHSIAGLTVPGVVTRLGASRVREMILAAACVPAEGTALVDTLPGPISWYSRRRAKTGKIGEIPFLVGRFIFLNGVPSEPRRFLLNHLCPESLRVLAERVSRREMPNDIPRTWIMTLRDRGVSVKAQRTSIEAIGGVDAVIPMNTCHDLMVSEPQRLAEILIQRCRARAREIVP
jgi:pimeloyl-ACP methyl ester carboxylesterase